MITYSKMPDRLYVVVIHYPALGIQESMAAIYAKAEDALKMIGGRGQDRIAVYMAQRPSLHSSGNIYSANGGLDYITIEKLKELAAVEKDPVGKLKDSEDIFKQSHEQN